MGHDPEPHDRPAPEPEITIEEFRKLYTFEIRRAIGECIAVTHIGLRNYYVQQGLEPDAAAKKASETLLLARRGQGLIHKVHPEPYRW